MADPGIAALDRDVDGAVVSYDGRRARRDRNNDAVIKACWELFAEGEMYPTAQQVAERSGVSLRSVFRHFQNLEALVATAVESYYAHFTTVFVYDGVGPDAPLADRIESLIAYRLRLYRQAGTVMRGAIARGNSDPHLAAVVRASREMAIGLTTALFATELERLAPAERPVVVAAVHTATLFDTWDNLATLHGLDDEGIAAAFRRLLHGALGA
jgi:AcrR family transcriptional regulator